MDLLRRQFKEFSNKTDEELEAAEKELNNLARLSESVRVGNYMTLKKLRADVLPEKPNVLSFCNLGRVFQWLNACEWLFINGEYGPCCVWARATLEFWLQELCLSLNEVDDDIKERIKNEKRNPSISELIGKLKEIGIMSNEFYEHCEVIKENGDVVVHTRLDKLASKDKIKTKFEEWKASKKVYEKISREDETLRWVQRGIMSEFWHDRARRSMERLYAVEQELYHLENPELSH